MSAPEANAPVEPVGPWGRRAALGLAAGVGSGLLLVGLAWWGASGEATLGPQYRWLALGLAGVIVCGAAGSAWVFAGMRAVGRRIAVAVPVRAEVPTPVLELRLVADGGGADTGSLVAAAGMRYYHRPSCALARGKSAGPAPRAEHLRAGRAACGVCRPDEARAGVSAA